MLLTTALASAHSQTQSNPQTSCGSEAATNTLACVQVVQGYKFNIFYPELIDKLEAPTYSLEKDPAADEHGGTCMLRYKAGTTIVDSQCLLDAAAVALDHLSLSTLLRSSVHGEEQFLSMSCLWYSLRLP